VSANLSHVVYLGDDVVAVLEVFFGEGACDPGHLIVAQAFQELHLAQESHPRHEPGLVGLGEDVSAVVAVWAMPSKDRRKLDQRASSYSSCVLLTNDNHAGAPLN